MGRLACACFPTADAVGGVWTYALDLASGLAARGVATTLAVLGPAPSDPAEARQIPGLRLIATGLPLDWLAPDRPTLRDTGAALACLAEGADIVHLNSPVFAAGSRFPAPVVGACHSCIATWWHAVHGGALPASEAWRRDALTQGYHAADLLLAPSSAFANATTALHRLTTAPRVVLTAGPRRLHRPARWVISSSPPGDCGTQARTSPPSTPSPPCSTRR